MKTSFAAALGVLLIVQCHSKSSEFKSPLIQPQNLTQTEAKNPLKEVDHVLFTQKNDVLSSKDILLIDLQEINKMSIKEYVKRQAKAFWTYLIHGHKGEPESTFVGRCVGVAKKIRQIMPMLMVGGGVVITKLAFLVLFSLKTIGLVGLLLLLNVATVAGKLGAYLASKKSEHTPQNLHVHVQPWKTDDHIYSSSHHGGPPYGWDDRGDTNIESHELYNLYEKLKFENDLRRYLSHSRT